MEFDLLWHVLTGVYLCVTIIGWCLQVSATIYYEVFSSVTKTAKAIKVIRGGNL